MNVSFKYDVFLSHSAKDKPAVRELAERLKADGLRVWLDEWEIQPGDLISLKIEEGLEQSRTLVLVMSQSAFASEWVTLERHTALFRDPTNQQRRFIPLRLDNADIKDALRQFAYVDWRQKAEGQYRRLLSSCQVLVAESDAKPDEQGKTCPAKVIRGCYGSVMGVAITSDGRLAISDDERGNKLLWDLETGECMTALEGNISDANTDIDSQRTLIPYGYTQDIAITTDGKLAVSTYENYVKVWDLTSGNCVMSLSGHKSYVRCVAIMPNGEWIVSGSTDSTIRIWESKSGNCVAILEGHQGIVSFVAISADGRRVVSGSNAENSLRVWEFDSGVCLAHIKLTERVSKAALTQNGKLAVLGCWDGTVQVWDLDLERCINTIEGHTGLVADVAVTVDGRLAFSSSADKTVRVWKLDTGVCLAIIKWHARGIPCLAIKPDGSRAISGDIEGNLCVWDLPEYDREAAQVYSAALYTNAKVLLVGDSGVGKSGLALRLTEDRFEPTISTDAAWATQMKLPHDTSSSDIEREIWLWDFAGQSDYRLIHQLFMDETALAVLVFNPQSENPFEGLGQWERDLQRAARRKFNKLLVAGRCDRGGLMVSRESIERFRAERGFDRYLETSAYTGNGCAELREAIIGHIAWDDIPWTSSPRIFKLLKEEIVKLKDEGRVLLRMGELKQQLEMRLPGESFTPEELRAVVGLLAGPGIVWQLEFGDFVLLQPERINAYAAAVIRSVRAHTDEIGCISEERVLAGDLDYQKLDNQKMERLPSDEEQIVLRAMHQILVDHSLCLREHTELGTLLVFPSYFKRERPELRNHPAAFVTYQFNGPLDEIYATLVVKMHHTLAFEKDQLWQFAADFKTPGSRRIGLKMTKKGEGAAEITVYFESNSPNDTEVTFVRYVHEHLKVKASDVVRIRHYLCPHCQAPVESNKAVQERLSKGLKDILCVHCEQRVPLWDLIEQKFASEEMQQRVREMEEQAHRSIDNESRELILVGHAFSIAGEAGQIFRPTPNSDWGIDGEIEFKNDQGAASGQRVYLQLKSGDSYLHERKGDGKEIFRIKEDRHVEYWQAQAYPVMLVIRTSDGQIRWMNVTDYLQRQGGKAKQIVFDGESFTALSLVKLRDRLFR